MFVTKYTHSCLLVENENSNYLIDPGVYSTTGGLNADELEKLDYLLITHEHEDHMDIGFVKEITKRFPDIIIKSNKSVVEILKSHSIDATFDSDERVTITEAPHEALFDKITPSNVAFKIENAFTHVGDSFGYSDKCEVVAFPIQAPWGSYADAIETIKALSPQKVIPIHDWHWRDEVRQYLQKRAQNYLKDYGIQLIPIEDRQRIEL